MLEKKAKNAPVAASNTHSAKGSFVLKGDICYSTSPTALCSVSDGYLVVEEGVVRGVFETLPAVRGTLPLYDYSQKLIIPGLVDLHTHASQYPFCGTGMDLQLLDWLNDKTFPAEVRYGDMAYAKEAYRIFAEAIRKSATTHACIFATRHREATEWLMAEMEQTGLVSFVGMVNMDQNAPAALCGPSAEEHAAETVAWLADVAGKYRRTKPILTPRFIPCCTPALLAHLQEIQLENRLPVQSHLSENEGEIAWVRELAPFAAFYGDAYDAFGLFGKERRGGGRFPTVMAHCVYSSDEEIERMRENGVFVAHCPASNTNLASGIAPIRRYLSCGLRVGLGSDVAAGHTLSILRAVTDAVQVSKLYWRLLDESAAPLTFAEAFYLATKGGGAFFGRVGSFEAGFDCSAVVLDDACLAYAREMCAADRLERAAYASLDLFGVLAKFVGGERVYEINEK